MGIYETNSEKIIESNIKCSNGFYKFSLVYLHALFVHLSSFVRAITCTFVHGFQNNWAQLVSLRSKSAV